MTKTRKTKVLLYAFLLFPSLSAFGQIALDTAKEAPIHKDSSELTDQFLQAAQEEGSIIFTPPDGWGAVDPQSLGLSKRIKAMVIGKSKLCLPPSMNLMVHPYPKTIQEYVKEIKAENDAIKADFKDLGTIRTQAGDGRFCQVDVKTQYGDVREMHVILKKDGQAIVLTAGALKEEFPRFYKEFFDAMRSLRFNTGIANHSESPR